MIAKSLLRRAGRWTSAVLRYVGVSIAALVVAELGARALHLRVADDPFIHFGKVPAFFGKVERDGKPYVRVINREIARERQIEFPKPKAPGTFRVFCLGSSASAGWPHPASESFSAYLEHALRTSYPNRSIEVINVSAVAYALYRTRLIFEQIMEFEPDLVILYAGNNEFVENRRYRERAEGAIEALAEKSVVYRIVRGSPAGFALARRDTLTADARNSVAFSEWSKIERMALKLRTEPAQFQRVKEHYAFCAEDIVRRAKNAKVPVLLVTVPVNLRDWPPNVSMLDGWAHSSGHPLEALKKGRGALVQGDVQAAITALRAATEAAPSYAAAHFYSAKAHESLEQHAAAIAEYDLARDLDANPFRALSSFNETLRQIAHRYDNATLIDADAEFRRHAAPFAPGFDLFIDYVHPNKRGNLILAKLIHAAVLDANLLEGAPAEPNFVERPSAYDEDQDLELQFTLLQLFEIMRQDELVVKKAEKLVERAGNFKEEWKTRAIHQALVTFPGVVDQERAELLGTPIPRGQREQLALQVRRFYQSNFNGYREFVKEQKNEQPSFQ